MRKFAPKPEPSPDLERDMEVMARLRGGDPDALEELLDRHWGLIVAYAGRLLGTQDAGEDVAQEVFLRLWQHRIECRPVGSLWACLYAVARHLTLNPGKTGSREVRQLPAYRAELEGRRP